MRRMLAVLVVAGVVMLGGCATGNYPTTTAQTLQAGVLAVSEASASGDWASATAELDELAAQLDSAVAEGTLDDARADDISAAIDDVRAELAALIAANQDDPGNSENAPGHTKDPKDPKKPKDPKDD